MSLKRLCSGAVLLMLASTGHSFDAPTASASFSYRLPRAFPVGTTARLATHADLNGDGKEDLILAGESAHMRERAVQILEGNGDGTFREGVTIDLQNPTRALAVADLNGDGKPDLILLHPGVGILLNTTPHRGGPISFGAEQSLLGGFGPALAAADLNGDGKAEVLVSTTPTRDATDNGSIRIALAPDFLDANHHRSVSTIEIPVPGVPVSLAVADLDGDGKPDVIAGFRAAHPGADQSGGIAVFSNLTESVTARLTFADPIVIPVGHAIDFVATANLNRDGRPDIFAAGCSRAREENCAAVSLISEPTPAGGVRFVRQDVPLTAMRASNWILQDINHDAIPDLLFLNRTQDVVFSGGAAGQITVALGLGDGRFAPPRTFWASPANTLGMVLGDFNHDGLGDLVILDASPQGETAIRILEGRKKYGFNAPELLTADFAPSALIPFSDHNQATGFVATDMPPSGLASSARPGHTAKVYTAESFDPPYRALSTVKGLPDGAVVVGDLNADGRRELVVMSASEIRVYDLDSKHRKPMVQAVPGQHPAPGAFTTPQRAILQDLDGDGKPDLIVGNGYERDLQIYRNTSNGTFSFAPPVRVPWCPKDTLPPLMKGFVQLSLGMASADMNGDGKPDLVVNGYCGLTLMLNRTLIQGQVVFDLPAWVQAGQQTVGQRLVAFTLVDMNHDGRTDIVAAENGYINNAESSTVDVLVNDANSSPHFRLAQHLQAGKRITSVASGDFNHDGWPDIALVDAEGTLSFLLNQREWNGAGGLALQASSAVMPAPQQLLLLDRPGSAEPALILRGQSSVAAIQ